MSELRLPMSQETQTPLLRFYLVWLSQPGGEGCEKLGWEPPVLTTILCHPHCPLPSFLCSHFMGQREDRKEVGVPHLPPTAPGSAHMAMGHGFCPAHETHLTQNLFQLLQFSLAVVEASLSDASASHTPPKEGEGARTNNGALWHPPQRPPGPTKGRRGTVPSQAWEAGASISDGPATFSLGRPAWAPQSCLTSLINRQ